MKYPNLEESDHGEEDLEEQDHDFQKILYTPPCQGDSILRPGDVQNVAPANQSSGVIRFRHIDPASQRLSHLHGVGPCPSTQLSLMYSCSSDALSLSMSGSVREKSVKTDNSLSSRS